MSFISTIKYNAVVKKNGVLLPVTNISTRQGDNMFQVTKPYGVHGGDLRQFWEEEGIGPIISEPANALYYAIGEGPATLLYKRSYDRTTHDWATPCRGTVQDIAFSEDASKAFIYSRNGESHFVQTINNLTGEELSYFSHLGTPIIPDSTAYESQGVMLADGSLYVYSIGSISHITPQGLNWENEVPIIPKGSAVSMAPLTVDKNGNCYVWRNSNNPSFWLYGFTKSGATKIAITERVLFSKTILFDTNGNIFSDTAWINTTDGTSKMLPAGTISPIFDEEDIFYAGSAKYRLSTLEQLWDTGGSSNSVFRSLGEYIHTIDNYQVNFLNRYNGTTVGTVIKGARTRDYTLTDSAAVHFFQDSFYLIGSPSIYNIYPMKVNPTTFQIERSGSDFLIGSESVPLYTHQDAEGNFYTAFSAVRSERPSVFRKYAPHTLALEWELKFPYPSQKVTFIKFA